MEHLQLLQTKFAELKEEGATLDAKNAAGGEAQEKEKAGMEARTKEATVAEREEKERQKLVKQGTRKKGTI